MSRSDPQFNLRIPIELKDYLEGESRKNKRSLTAEILDRLETSAILDKKNQETNKKIPVSDSTSMRLLTLSAELAKMAEKFKKNN